MTADLSDVVLLLGGSVAICAGPPLLYAWWRTSAALLLLYVHAAALLTLGGLLGAIFVVPVGDDVALLGGQITYAGFMYTVLLTVFVGRDVRVVRNIVLLTIAVNLVKYVLFLVGHQALTTDGISNPYGTSAGVFDQSLRVVTLGGALILVELIALLAVLEWAKPRVPSWGMRLVYVASFVAILALDGVLFPTVVLPPADDMAAAISAGFQAKVVLAGMFAVPLTAFVLLDRRHLQHFASTPLRLSYLVTTPPAHLVDLLEAQEQQIAAQRASLDLSTTQMGDVRATVEGLLDSATGTILIAIDRNLRVTHFSAGAQNVTGYAPRQVVGNEIHMLFERSEVARQAAAAGEPHADLGRLIDTLASDGVRRDWSFRTASGEPLMLSLTVTPIRTDHGVIGYVLAGEDVTERLRRTQSLADALEREQQTLANLQSADRLRNELVFTVSHELSTPITSIAGYLEMLQESDDPLSDWQRDALERAVRNTVRLRRLVEDLRLISQVDTGTLPDDPTELDLREVVDSCHDQVLASLRTRDLELDWRIVDRPVPVRGDLATLREVVLRLTGNAVKFTPDGGRIGVELGLDEGGASLTVTDTGIGIPEDDQRRIFGRFERGSEVETRAIQGVGLGLSIVSTVVRRHGGRIQIDSAPGRGTTVRVVLPVAEGGAAPDGASDAASDEASDAHDGQSDRTDSAAAH